MRLKRWRSAPDRTSCGTDRQPARAGHSRRLGTYREKFEKVMPLEYRRVLGEQKQTDPKTRAARLQESRAYAAMVTSWVIQQVLSKLPESRRNGVRCRERIQDWKEVYKDFPEDKLKAQASRCMDCGVPFCHQGCPLGNIIPDWNDLVYRDDGRKRLHVCSQPTISRNSPDASVRRRAKAHVCSASMPIR